MSGPRDCSSNEARSRRSAAPHPHPVSNSSFSDDWVEVSRIGHCSAKEGDIHLAQAQTSCGQASIAYTLDFENTSTGPCSALHPMDLDQGEFTGPMVELQAQSRVPERLKEEIHLARARAQQMRQQHREAEQQLVILEKFVREQQNQEAANCACWQCCCLVTLDDDARSDGSDESSNVPAVVEDYFQLDREAFVCDERLMELEFEHKEAEAAREDDCSRGDDLHTAAEEAEVLYRRTRKELSEALAIAHYRLHLRRNACFAEGIDPERYRYRRR